MTVPPFCIIRVSVTAATAKGHWRSAGISGDLAVGEVVLVQDLIKRYKELTALDGLNLSVHEGEIFGLLGPNGSGKTTTINCILGLLKYDGGSIRVFGEEMTPDSFRLRRRIGIVPQAIAVSDELTVQENIDFFCGLYVDDRKKRRQLVEEAIRFTGLEQFRRFRPKKLSGGLLRRLNIACGIAHQPDLIFMDEPTVAVDPQSREHILDGIRQLRERGATVIYTTHYMEEVEQICDRIAIIDKGKNVALGTLQELKQLVKYTETIQMDLPGTMAPDSAAESFRPVMEQLRALPHTASAQMDGSRLTVVCSGGTGNLMQILQVLENRKISFRNVTATQPSLNDVFMEITGRELRDV